MAKKVIQYGKTMSGGGALIQKGGPIIKRKTDAIQYNIRTPKSDFNRRPNK